MGTYPQSAGDVVCLISSSLLATKLFNLLLDWIQSRTTQLSVQRVTDWNCVAKALRTVWSKRTPRTAAWSSSLGTFCCLMGATRLFRRTKLGLAVSAEASGWRAKMTTAKAEIEASVKTCRSTGVVDRKCGVERRCEEFDGTVRRVYQRSAECHLESFDASFGHVSRVTEWLFWV